MPSFPSPGLFVDLTQAANAWLSDCSSHYPAWQAEYPEASSRFRPGAFGENLVTRHMNERNVCIGDIVQVGPVGVGPLLQVSLPRQPVSLPGNPQGVGRIVKWARDM